jgi:2-oxoisovalerate dehydrogenase E1 component
MAAQLLQGNELTVITWGAMVHRCLEAAREFSHRVTLLDLRTILPWDKNSVLESVHHTGKVLVVHEDTITNGFAAEIIATISEKSFSDLDAPIMRIATPDIPIPYNISLMESILPSEERIHTGITNLLNY